MPRFRKKPVEIEAVQITVANGKTWDGNPFSHAPQWLLEAFEQGKIRPHQRNWTDYAEWDIVTLEGTMTAGPGDWIIRGIKGELYPCKDDVFRQTYEPVDEQAERAALAARGGENRG